MTDQDPPHQDPDSAIEGCQPDQSEPIEWSAARVLRQRADAARRVRDESVGELRGDLSDDDILETFGINLDEIED